LAAAHDACGQPEKTTDFEMGWSRQNVASACQVDTGRR